MFAIAIFTKGVFFDLNTVTCAIHPDALRKICRFYDDMKKMLCNNLLPQIISQYNERCFIFAGNKFRQCSSFDGIIRVATVNISKFLLFCGRVRGSSGSPSPPISFREGMDLRRWEQTPDAYLSFLSSRKRRWVSRKDLYEKNT